jgi:hypothetical protein
MSGCAVVECRDPRRAAGHIPVGFGAPQANVLTFSVVAPRLVEECLAALPARVFQQALRRPLPPSGPPRKNPNRPPHRLTLFSHFAEGVHSCQYFFERPGLTLTLIISNSKAPGNVLANSVGSDMYCKKVFISIYLQAVAMVPGSLPQPDGTWIFH